MKTPWYLRTWLLCILFAAWPLYGIPLVAGIVLLFLSNKTDKNIISQFEELTNKSQQLNDKLIYSQQLLKEMGAMDIVSKRECIRKLELEVAALEEKRVSVAAQLEMDIRDADSKIAIETEKLNILKKDLIVTDEEILVQSYGLYSPKFEFVTSEKYRAEIEKIRMGQKDLIKNDDAATGNINWTVNGSAAQGKKMVKDMQKLLLRAFNSECDELVSKVKYNNFEVSLARISKSCEAISKLGKIMSVEITPPYYNAKIDELRLALEYQQKKQQEKEEQKAIREQMREDARAQRELEEQRLKIEKEQNHYQQALLKLEEQLGKATEQERIDLLNKKKDVEETLVLINKTLQDVDYRQANQKAGYVYIISNVGAFGENVYKIGMTRRLNPEERVDELGDASVPFDFDVHAMIFCEDAPKLEAALHKKFENNKLNWVNTRREFFNVTLNEIKNVVKANYDKTAEFIDVAEAEQFRTSQRLRQQLMDSQNQ
jgi:hypothetical protein